MKLTKKEAQLEAARGAVWTALWQVPRYQAIHELKTRVFTRWDQTTRARETPAIRPACQRSKRDWIG